MAKSPTPKFRLSYSLEQLQLLQAGLEALEDTELSKSLMYFQTLENLRTYTGGSRSPAYVATGEKPGRKITAITPDDLGAEEASVPAQTYETVEDCKKAFVSFYTIYKPMGFPAPADLQGACQAWLAYCSENDMDPMKEAGLSNQAEEN